MLPSRLFGNVHFYWTSSREPDKAFMQGLGYGPFTPRRGSSTYNTGYFSGNADVKAVDLTGDGNPEVVGLFNGELNGIHIWDNRGHLLGEAAFGAGPRSPMPSWEKSIPALSMRGMAIADLTGNGEKEICVITSRGFAVALNWRGERLWSTRLPSEPLSICGFAANGSEGGCVVIGTRGGEVYEIDSLGRFSARARVGGSAVKAVALGVSRYAVATSEGGLIAFDLR